MQRAHHRAPPTGEKTGMMMSEKPEPVFVTSEKMGLWNCRIDKFAIEHCRTATPGSMGCCL
jgi:hypothetical protein